MSFKLDERDIVSEIGVPIMEQVKSSGIAIDVAETAWRRLSVRLAAQIRPRVRGAREDEGLEALLGRLVAAQDVPALMRQIRQEQCPGCAPLSPALLADIRRELAKTRPAAPSLEERRELIDLLERAAGAQPPEPPADLVGRAAQIIHAADQQRAKEMGSRLPPVPWERVADLDKETMRVFARAVLSALASGDVGE